MQYLVNLATGRESTVVTGECMYLFVLLAADRALIFRCIYSSVSGQTGRHLYYRIRSGRSALLLFRAQLCFHKLGPRIRQHLPPSTTNRPTGTITGYFLHSAPPPQQLGSATHIIIIPKEIGEWPDRIGGIVVPVFSRICMS